MSAVLILDDDKDLTFLMTELFKGNGTQCVVARSFHELQSRKSEIGACDLAILDINLGSGQPTGIEAYHWLIGQHFSGKIVFFTGHAKFHPLVQKASQIPGVKVIEKPTSIENLLALVGEC